MKRVLKIFLFLGTILPQSTLVGQIVLTPTTIPVIHQDNPLSHPFAGGLNSGQYYPLDMDQDGDLDLVIFDRSSDKFNCFENRDQQYFYNPAFASLFPEGIQNWIVLKDYDCDGDQDLFASAQLGIQVYQNVGTDEGLAWEMIANPLLTNQTTNPINIFLNSTDIPVIEDLDGDGDLDILVFDFATGITIEHHQNLSYDNQGLCDLTYIKSADSYGGIHVCECSDYVFDTDCKTTAGRLKHLAGKALLALDQNLDGRMDLLISEEDCNQLNYLQNIGSATTADFDNYRTDFPSLSQPVDYIIFPAAYYMDVTFDGQDDLIVAPNVRDNTQGSNNMQASSWVYPNQGSNAFPSAQTFLQHGMIDVGDWAYPAWVDVDGDNRDDLILGNSASHLPDGYVSSLSYYARQADGSLQYMSNDAFGLSQLSHQNIKPQFVDLTQDGKLDLVFSSVDASYRNQIQYIPNTSPDAGLKYNPDDLTPLTLSYNNGDDIYFYDYDQDGQIDALIGRTYGELDYFRNNGNLTFDFTEGNILQETGPGNLALAIGDIDTDGSDDLILTDRSGQVKIYFGFPENQSNYRNKLIQYEGDEARHTSRLGRYSKPALGQDQGIKLISFGTIQGGLWLFESSILSPEKLELTVYPNPSQPDRQVSFRSNLQVELQLLTLWGETLLDGVVLEGEESTTIDLSNIQPGLYIAYIRDGKRSTSQKLILK
ncbi:hypothetical protein BFP72_16085 [Reichenbachiella sp. 5M10]|uniref:T9SS type A sorting domain-containing protein n=1 Tax=Reichenbachiella sp. 5M10 TaxID=1889772 RepID=UPI000C14D7DE|nr:T9SS type A sorting domain-containing protein [Reichenbachiella sp. 5M10]PIB36810.1 hypothetical protein BFP72_16085 [Reichenbachiella sp. 5M10]